MAQDVVVPEVGELGMEVTLVRWLKAPGDAVAIGDVLFEVDTAKAILEVEAYAAGTLAEVSAAEGDLVSPRQVVARILEPGEVSSADATSTSVSFSAHPRELREGVTSSTPSAVPGMGLAPPPSAGRTGVPGASPRARRLARVYGVDLATLVGSGPDGLITERDVLTAAGSGEEGEEGP